MELRQAGCRVLTSAEFGFKTDLLESWARLFLLNSTPYLMIYALPGSGKTTFQHSMQRKGIPCSDTDDTSDENRMRREFKKELKEKGMTLTHAAWIGSEVQKLKDRQYWEHDAAWRYALVSFPNMIRLTVTNLHNYALKESQKLGVTVVTVRLDRDAYLARAAGREDLAIYPLGKWWDESAGVGKYVAHVVARDFSDLLNLGTTHITGFGSRGVNLFKVEPPNDDYDTRRAVGRMLRDNILLWGRLNERDLHFIGSEVETVEMLRRFGMRSRVSGFVPKPFGLDNNPFLQKGGSSARESLGQKKLFAVDFPFATANCEYIIAVGGSPGEHWIDLMGEAFEKKLIIFDRVKPAYSKAIWIRSYLESVSDIPAKYRSKRFVFLSDIRRDDHTEEGVGSDNATQFRWARELVKHPNCVGISLKFRPQHESRTFTIPSNFMCVFQPWNAGSSRETRLFWKPEMGRTFTMRTMETAKYHDSLEKWNTARVYDPELERKQERLLATSLIEDLDYRTTAVKGPQTLVGLYTVSNGREVEEVRGLIFFWMSMGLDFIISLPFKPVFDALVETGDAAVVTGLGGNDGRFMPSDLLGLPVKCYSIADWVTQMDYGWGDHPAYCDTNISPSHCCGGSPYMKEWFIVTNITVPRSSEFQTWLNNQTWMTKFVTAKLRDIFGHTNSSLHQLRRDVIAEAGFTPIDDHRINGSIVVDGVTLYVAVSGHLINMVLASRLFPVDFPRWVGTIRKNLESIYTRRGRTEWHHLWSNGQLAEDGEKFEEPQLFHSYYDFVYGIIACRRMVDTFGFIVDENVLSYLTIQFDTLLTSFPRWRMSQSFLADEYGLENATG